MWSRKSWLPLFTLLGMSLGLSAAAQSPGNAVAASGNPVPAAPAPEQRSINDWLMRMHEASRKGSYVGTFVVSSGSAMSSARIWHVCQGDQQVERVETLTGPPRSVFRHNDQVLTLMPDQKVGISEKRESLGAFPGLLKSTDTRIGDFYWARPAGADRVAGVEADVVELVPRDALRFGYRVWAEQKNGLVVKLQTLDTEGKVLEQSAFSELQLDVPLRMDKLVQLMSKVDGYRIEKPAMTRTTASAEGWALKSAVAGFKSMSCYKRPSASSAATPASTAEPMQWIFSDGLASVSLFVEPFDRQRHGQESSLSLGATQTLTRRIDGYWLTAMGEVPMSTLRLFAAGLERRKP